MRRHGLTTKREAVDVELRKVAGTLLNTDFLLSLRGVGWGADLDELRPSRLRWTSGRRRRST